LCGVVSSAFYCGALQTAPPKALDCQRVGGPHLVFIPMPRGQAESADRSTSLFNALEAEKATEYAMELIESKQGWTVAVLAFYKEQVRLLKELLDGEPRVCALSVDSSQGQEFDAVILTAVVDGSRRSFLQDARRQCVAISRAKQRLVIVAHPRLCDNIRVFRRLCEAAS